MKDKIKIILFKIFTLLPIKKNKIVCNNFNGKGYGDNPKYIVNELLIDNNYDIVWICQSKYSDSVPKGVRVVTGGIRGLYEYATAKIWISNVRLPLYLTKRRKQFYIQTWHGGLGLKKCEKDVINTLTPIYIKMMDKDSKMIDLAISNSKFLTNVYNTALDYHGTILEKGLPRNDSLISNNEDFKYLKNKFNIRDELVLLYAPTFRDNYRTNVYNVDMDKLINTLEKTTNKKWKVLVKFHPNVNNADEIFNFSDKIINCSDYGDINELFLITDLLLTDYSSCMFDFMLLNRKIYLYAPDIEEFMKERDFMIDINKLPFPLAKNMDELLNVINTNINNKDVSKYDKFLSKYGMNETGKSAYEVKKIIDKVIGGKYEV